MYTYSDFINIVTLESFTTVRNVPNVPIKYVPVGECTTYFDHGMNHHILISMRDQDVSASSEVIFDKIMPNYDILGITVRFPYKAYECQIKLMESVIKSLKSGSNALVESPTGTGKTLCLLCSVLAWREALAARNQLQELDSGNKKELLNSLEAAVFSKSVSTLAEIPKIYYASRTHSQLSQVMKELRNTSYKPIVSVLGSRDQLCIHEEVYKAPSFAKKGMCRAKVSKKACSFYAGAKIRKTVDEIMDIEELAVFGKKHNACPYYLSKEIQSKSDIIFLPYNYLIDANARKAQNIDVKNAIIIFDEAHNLEGVCTESTSFEINTNEINACSGEIAACIEVISQNPNVLVNAKDFSQLRETIQKLSREILKVPLQGSSKEFVQNGDYVYEFFMRAGINFGNASSIIHLIEQAQELLTSDSKKKIVKVNLRALEDALKIVFREEVRLKPKGIAQWSKSYKMCVTEGDPWANSNPGRNLNYWCFHSSVALHDLMLPGIHSTILASGTLSPLSSFAHEMGIPFDNRIENPHVISNDQVMIAVIPKGPNNYRLSSSYENRNSSESVIDMGNAILNFIQIIPEGVLVFFPSYTLMQQNIEAWKRKGIWDKISGIKVPITEPKGKVEFSHAILTFYEKLKDRRFQGAIFFAVCRGKASEGIDFSDAKGRAVIVCGIPYPAAKDPKILLKKKYLDDLVAKERNVSREALNGAEWYRQQASRAVNQAIGRVIRHRKDFGAILLCDDRFGLPYNISQLSAWVRPLVKVYNRYDEAKDAIKSFFERNTVETNNQSKTPLAMKQVSKGHYELLKESEFSSILERKVTNAPMFGTNLAENIPNAPSLHNTSMDRISMTQNRQALIGSTTISSKREIQRPKAGDFLKKLKQSLSSKSYEEFTHSLKNFKGRKVPFTDLMTKISKLFEKVDNELELLEGFRDFVPRKYHADYQLLIEAKKKNRSA